ncbi:activating transcription factor 7-interacting protein 1 isoform X1 [Rhizophagus irregularis DAOM 181602=DAOM 197198]|nr:activating transcription factor 7-interacting protein 1 isoform X1 [Rhizophagus irregularis DAOM 181602=DAOM 197198]
MPPQKSQNKSKKNKKTFTYVAPTEEEIKSMQTAARGKATHNSTSTWINALETFPEVISIPADNAVIQDYELYFSKRPPICEDAFYLQPCNNNEVEFTGYWFKSAQMGEKLVKGLMKEIATITEIDCDKRKFTNHSGRKTFIQISKSEGISDNDVMSVSRHKNPHSLAYYERPKSILQQNTLSQINSLIYNDTLLSNDKTANSFSSALETFNESRSPLQQLNSNDLNELNDDQQNQEINGNDETIKKILHGNVFQNLPVKIDNPGQRCPGDVKNPARL